MMNVYTIDMMTKRITKNHIINSLFHAALSFVSFISYLCRLESSDSMLGNCQQLIIVDDSSDIEVPHLR